MKSKEEIEYAAANLANPNACKTTNWIEGYTQCQEDMADEMVRLKNTVQLSVDLLCEADEEIALLKKQLLGFQNP